MGQWVRTTVGATTWQVPAGVSSITIKCWGAGGGGGGADDGTGGSGSGGGGGFAVGTVTVTPLDTLDVHVGGGGGGGTGGNCGQGGGGGGQTYVEDSGTPLIHAGAGGGGGGGDNSTIGAGYGGAGGGSTGGTGGDDEGLHGTPVTTGGVGGTQSGGGAGGAGNPTGETGDTDATGYGGEGGQGNAGLGGGGAGGTGGGGEGGGTTGSYGSGGGGGAGYHGGGGGGGGTASDAGGGGGGGGSNYVSGTGTTNTQGTRGVGDDECGTGSCSGGTGAGQGDGDYQAATGDGGANAADGGSGNGGSGEDGAVVINWTDPPEGNWDQDAFRAREASGTESGASWKAALNTDWDQAPDETFRIRFVVQEEDDQAVDDCEFQLQYSKNSGTWTDVNATSSNVRSTADGLTDGANTTQQLGSGTFVTPNAGCDEVNGIAGGASCDFTTTANQETEVEFSVQVRSADTSHNDTIELRVVFAPSTAFDTYTNTPEITVKFPPAFRMKTSTWITDGESTTRQLSVPGGGASAFDAGEVKEDDPDCDAATLGAGNATEYEFCMEASTQSESGEQYEFRIVDDTQKGEKCEEYAVTPKVTIAP